MADPGLLRSVREAKGLTLRHVAAEANLDPTALSRIERGLREPRSRTLGRIYAALGLTAYERAILTRDDP